MIRTLVIILVGILFLIIGEEITGNPTYTTIGSVTVFGVAAISAIYEVVKEWMKGDD